MPAVFIDPVGGAYTLTAGFGQSGGLWSSGQHTGQDFAAPRGTPVVAAAGGMVTFAGVSGKYGNRVEITHANGMVTTYSHLDRIDVRRFQPVGQAHQIGTIGTTGNTTGAHLHFEVKVGGRYVDPLKYIGSGVPSIPEDGGQGGLNPLTPSSDLDLGGFAKRGAYFLGGMVLLLLGFMAIRKGGLK